MPPNLKEILPSAFSPKSRVWIYQSNRRFLDTESITIQSTLSQFSANWKSHGDPLKGFATLLLNQFIIIMADEALTQVSGCSTDSSVKMIKELEQSLGVELFNRTNLSFLINDKVQTIPMVHLSPAYKNKLIGPDTLYFNNTILTKSELEENWIIPIKNSWLYQKIV